MITFCVLDAAVPDEANSIAAFAVPASVAAACAESAEVRRAVRATNCVRASRSAAAWETRIEAISAFRFRFSTSSVDISDDP